MDVSDYKRTKERLAVSGINITKQRKYCSFCINVFKTLSYKHRSSIKLLLKKLGVFVYCLYLGFAIYHDAYGAMGLIILSFAVLLCFIVTITRQKCNMSKKLGIFQKRKKRFRKLCKLIKRYSTIINHSEQINNLLTEAVL